MSENDKRLNVRPVSGHAIQADAAALEIIQSYSANELPRMQARADKWTAGLTAITGVLTTAVVIKGPETFTDVTASWQVLGLTLDRKDLIIGLMFIGGLLIGLGIIFAYKPAHGSPLKDSALEELVGPERPRARLRHGFGRLRTPPTQLESRSGAQATAPSPARCCWQWRWSSPGLVRRRSSPRLRCIRSDSTIIKFDGPLPAVTQGELTIVPCSP
jgi:hypothetical protein